MKLSVRTKYFLIFLSVSMLIVISMLIFTRWSIQSGFISYIEDRQARRMEYISERLLEHYERHHGWQQLVGNKRIWLRVLFGYQQRQPDHFWGYGEEQDGRGKHRYMHPPHIRLLLRDSGTDWPSDRILNKLKGEAPRLPFEARLMLFDSDKKPIHGRIDQLENSNLYPLVAGDTTVGYLALIRGSSLTDTGHIRFIAQQHTGLIWIGLGIIILSALIAVYLSKRLVDPVQAFRNTAHRLASGEYESRVSIDRTDELGDLAKDINQLAESLQANENARRQWVADIAHELRTPLSVIQSELEALQSGIRDLNQSAVNSLHEDTLRLGRLIDDLYDLSITDLGALSYRKEELHINDILQDDIDSMRDAFTQADISLYEQMDDTQEVVLWADSQRLSQLFRNILKNSLRYTNTPGKLEIRTSLQKGQLLIQFIDSSPGVPETALPHLFDRLYRVENSRCRDTGGTGLGLAIARNIVQAHGGEITASPSELGGLCIEIRFTDITRQ